MANLPAMSFQHAISGAAAGSRNNGRLGPLDLTEASDEELMHLVQARNQGAFARLLDRHLTSIHSYVYRMTRNATDAEDIAQETFIRLWQRASTFQPGRAKFSTWLYRIAHNLCVDEFRKRDSTVDGNLDKMSDDSLPASTQRLAEERLEAVYSALHALPERQRSALLLCQLHGWSNKQAAEMMDISVDALESLIARARRTLKTLLRHLMDF